MYRKELPVGDRVTEEPSLAHDQLSEYDSDSSDNEDSSNNEEDAVEGVPVNLFIKDSAHAYRKTHHAFISGSFIVLRYEELIPFCPQHT